MAIAEQLMKEWVGMRSASTSSVVALLAACASAPDPTESITLDREPARSLTLDATKYLGKCLLNFDTANGIWYVIPNREAGPPYVSGGYAAQAEVLATQTENGRVINTKVVFKIAPSEKRIAISQELKGKVSMWSISQESCSAFEP